jgi:enoyl-CoA hydratase
LHRNGEAVPQDLPLRIERDGAVGLVTLARPERDNVLDTQTVAELTRHVRDLGTALIEPVRALVVTGSGGVFSTGMDIAELRGMGPAEARELARSGQALCAAIEAAPFPTIAAVDGLALGAGFEIVLACDFVYASERARFGLPEVRLGLIPGFGGSQRLPRRIGLPRARELLYSGALLGAVQSRELGLVNRVLAPARVLERALAEAHAIAERAPLAVAALKRVTLAGRDLDLHAACRNEAEAFANLFASRDAAEGTQAFLEGREPEFLGE